MTRSEPLANRPIRVAFEWWRLRQSRLLSLTQEPEQPIGSVLMLPPLGLTAANLFMPAFYAASAGARTVRFDGRNNVGLSDGAVRDFKLGVLLDDARFAADRLARTTGSDDFIIYGMSLTATVALLLARDFPRARVILFVPVVDPARAIEKAAGEQGVMEPYRRRDPDAATVRPFFGHDICGQPFFDDLTELGLDSVEGVLAAATRVAGRVDLVMAEHDQFSSAEDRQRLVDALDARNRTLVLPAATHDFGHKTANRKRAFKRLMEVVEDHFGLRADRSPAELPEDSAMVAAARMEQAALKLLTDRAVLAA